MIGSLNLPAIALLAAISGLPGLKGLPTPASKEHAKAKAAAVAADTLPMPWKPLSRVSLERQFLQYGLDPIGKPYGPIKLLPLYDPRKARVSVDPDSGTYRSVTEVGEVTLGAGYRRPLSSFALDYSRRNFRDRWQERARRDINNLGSNTPQQRTGLSLPIPVRLPSPVQSLLGPGGPALNVSGSESIRLSGTSNWTNQKLSLLGQRQSLFPSLDMQQDLDIRLEGQLSDRIKVNLLQNSANQIPLANRIAINYRGDEDDFVQALDLGNTSLTLPGTQYVSYSGKNEGLFGIKMASRIGALDFTALASKQEGRSERAVYTGGASVSKPQPFTDLDWVKGQYFLLYDPGFGSVYDIDEKSIRLYLDDANGANDNNVIEGKAVIDPNGVMGIPLSQAERDSSVRGRFDLLKAGADQQYEVLNNFFAFRDTIYKVIRLKQPIQPFTNMTLAVSYNVQRVIGPNHQLGAPDSVGGQVITAPGDPDAGRTLLKLLRVPRNLQKSTTDGSRFDTTAVFAKVRELELKNVYNLNGFGIDPLSFKLQIRRGQTDPPVTDMNGLPFIELLGIDSWNEQTSQAQRGHDGQVDATGYNSVSRKWVDYQNGVLVLPDLRPFAPRLSGPGARPFDQFLDNQVNRRRLFDGAHPDSLNSAETDVYELYNPRPENATYYFLLEYAAARSGGSDITLGRGNLLEGSEAVVVNGERWTRDRDYTIDYDLGRVTLKRQLGPSDQLAVDYSYAPLFAQASKTLVGSAFRVEGRDRSFGGAFLYESRGAQDLRPRLGEEPSRTLITDLNTEWRFKPSFMTRLADALPGVRTTTPSEFNIQAEGGLSFPNPNTRNEVFVDDMEGVRDAVSLTFTPDRWRWMSVPRRATAISQGTASLSESFLNLPRQRNAEVHWYQPGNATNSDDNSDLIRERELRPRLPEALGANGIRQVLGISVPRKPASFTPGDTMWAGVMYSLDAVGLDLSRAQFLELWVNDWNDHHDPIVRTPRIRGNGTPGSSVKLHIDLGRVSEDQMRAPNRPPNGRIDTEDRQLDGQLTVTEGETEDTGLDGVLDAGEPAALANSGLPVADLATATTSDPEGDNWGTINESFGSVVDPRRYVAINGTEGSRELFPLPDTEDLNLNRQLDQDEAYFEYTIDLGDQSSPYLITDVLRDFPGDPVADSTRNGWRRYRIPITDSLRVRYGFPDLTLTQHVRIWMEGLREDEQTASAAQRPLLMLGGFEIVGSRWQATDLTPRQRDTLKTVSTLNSVNTTDNAEVYVAPFDPGTTRNGSQSYQRREQSISLEFTDLYPADTLEAYKAFSLAENYSRYGVLRWYAQAFNVRRIDAAGNDVGGYDPAQDSLWYFVRFASDDKGTNYYEVRRRMPRSAAPLEYAWEDIRASIEEMAGAKLDTGFVKLRDPILFRTQLADGSQLTIKGRPSFTRLLRISFGVLNEDTTRAYRYSGQLWFDEVRATDVAKDIGFANRVLVNGRWANLMDYNVSWNSRDADFLSVGETRGSGNKNTNLNVSTRFEPHRFFEGTGIQLPVSFTQNQNSSRPRFAAGDDIVREGRIAEQSETRSTSRTMSASYSRVWSDRSNPLLRYTLGGFTGNISRSTTDARSPTSLSNSTNIAAGVSYQIAPRQLLPVPMPFTKTRFFPLPERFYWNYGVMTTRSSAFSRVFGSDDLVPSSSQNGRAANIDFGADTRPFDLLSHHVEGRRNLSLEGVRNEKLGGLNMGRLVSWRQSFSSHLAINPHPWLRPSFNWTSNYYQNNDTQSRDVSVRAIGNGQELGVTWDLPFDRLTAGPIGVRQVPTKPDTGRNAKKPSAPGKPLLPWRALLSHLGAVSADGRIGRNTNYSRMFGTASPLYLIGLAENPGFDGGGIEAMPGNQSSTGLDWRGNARTTVPLMFGTSIQTRLSMGDRTNNNNGVLQRTRDQRFPDLEVQYGRVANLIGLSRLLDGAQLRTAYARNTSSDYQNSRSERTGTSRSDEFRPLFSVRGRLKNGTDTDLRLERRSSKREVFLPSPSRQNDQTTNINFSMSRSYSQGQKVNLLGKTSTVKTNVNLQMTTVYERQKGGIFVGNETEPRNPVDRTRLSVNGTGSYGFSSNVTGDLALGFSHFKESNGIIRRSIRVELRGQFRF